jgi:hypothetical protein
LEPHKNRNSHSMQDRGELIVRAAFARFDVVALGIAMGCVGALGLWAATAILLVKGAPPGVTVGPHLALLTNFLPGYNVSWPGSVVGLFYGFLVGLAFGVLIAVVWNVVHHIYLVQAVTRRFFADEL